MENTADHESLFGQFLWAEALVMLAAAGVALGFGVDAAYSALLGGMTSLVPDYYFARRVFRRYANRSPEEVAALRRSEDEFTGLVNGFLHGRESPRYRRRRIESQIRDVATDEIEFSDETDTEQA